MSSGATSTTPSRLPSVGRLLLEAWVAARRRPVATFVGLPAVTALAVVGCLVPWINFPFLLLGLPSVLGALPTIALAVAQNRPMSPWAPFAFRRMERFLGLFWIQYLVAVGGSAPLLVVLYLDRRVPAVDAGPWLLGGAGLLGAAGVVAVLLPYAAAPFLAVELDPSMPMGELLDRSRRLLHGKNPAILLRIAGLLAVALSGLALFGIGAWLTAPLAAVAAGRLYEHLAQEDRAFRASRKPLESLERLV